MATQRTFDEKMEILDHCMELEKSGGDILGYLWSQNYLTPRATWFNYQREWLGRKPYEFTDGKPTKKHERTEREVKHRKLTNEEKKRAVQIAIDGGDPRRYLGNELGLLDPQAAWWKIKNALKTADPDLYAKLPERLDYKKTGNFAKKDKGMPKQAEKPATVKVDGPIRIETEKPEEVTVSAGDAMKSMEAAADEFFGKCEEMGLMKSKPKITKPVNYDGFHVRGIEGEFGTYIYSETNTAKYIDYNSKEDDQLSMTIEHWRGFVGELKRAFAVLGVEL